MSSPVWSVTIGIRDSSEWWPGRTNRDQLELGAVAWESQP